MTIHPKLRIQLWLNRLGLAPVGTAFIVLLALWLHFFATPQIQQKTEVLQANILALASQEKNRHHPDGTGKTTALSLRQLRHTDFRHHLIDKNELPNIIRVLFGVASDNHLQLTQADYKLGTDQAGQYRTYRLTAPIKGSYGDIRRFINEILEKFPAIALEEVSFKRDNIGADITESKLRFVIFLKKEN